MLTDTWLTLIRIRWTWSWFKEPGPARPQRAPSRLFHAITTLPDIKAPLWYIAVAVWTSRYNAGRKHRLHTDGCVREMHQDGPPPKTGRRSAPDREAETSDVIKSVTEYQEHEEKQDHRELLLGTHAGSAAKLFTLQISHFRNNNVMAFGDVEAALERFTQARQQFNMSSWKLEFNPQIIWTKNDLTWTHTDSITSEEQLDEVERAKWKTTPFERRLNTY